MTAAIMVTDITLATAVPHVLNVMVAMVTTTDITMVMPMHIVITGNHESLATITTATMGTTT